MGILLHSLTVVQDVLLVPALTYDTESSLIDLWQQIGDIVNTGGEYTANGANLQLDRSEMVVSGRMINARIAELEPHLKTLPIDAGITGYDYSHQTAPGVFTSSTNAVVIPDQYDTGSGLSSVPAGKWIWQPIQPDPRSGRTTIQHAQAFYDTLEEAIDGVNQNGYLHNPLFSLLQITTVMIVQQGTVGLSGNASFHPPLRFMIAPSGVAPAHTVASHSDTTATGAELETLTDGSNADALHVHAGGGGGVSVPACTWSR